MLQHQRKRKKHNYNEQILQIDHGTFKPLVFSLYGGMGRECKMFYSRLAELVSMKQNIVATNWIRTKIYYALLKELHYVSKDLDLK